MFGQKYEKYQNVLSVFHFFFFLLVKFSVELIRHVFVTVTLFNNVTWFLFFFFFFFFTLTLVVSPMIDT